jgi:two-component system, NarL family, nitrate/nitrite response regulator NarL
MVILAAPSKFALAHASEVFGLGSHTGFAPGMKQLKDPGRNRVIKLFLLVENRLLRDALAGIVRKQPDFSVVGADRYAPSIEKQVIDSRCDVLVADHATAMTFPSDFVPDTLTLAPDMKIILLGMEEDPEIFLQAVRAGVSGYLLGDASAEETLVAVRRVASGEAVCPPKLCGHLFQFVAREARKGSVVVNQRVCAKLGLTPRQQQLVSFLARGLTNKEIAASLNLSEYTVKNHVHRIMRQVNADSRYAAVQTVCENAALGVSQPS